MLEIYSIRKDLTNTSQEARYHVLYRIKGEGMWYDLFVWGDSEEEVRSKMQKMYEDGWLR